MRSSISSFALLAGALLVVGCGAGPYGHSRVYAPLGGESAATEGAEELDPVMARRDPARWHVKKVSLFGIVTKRADAGPHAGKLTLSVRTLAARNLCESADEESCRVTVSSHEFDVVEAAVRFTDPADELGELSVGVGSLVRVVGSIAPDAGDGALVVQAAYYRHWPRGYYVTDEAASVLRR
jgi:hypothetical protein